MTRNRIPETRGPVTYRVPLPDGQTVVMVRTWTDEQAADIIGRAIDIVTELDPPEDLRAQTFATALNLCGQMAPRQSNVVVAPPMHALDNGKKA